MTDVREPNQPVNDIMKRLDEATVQLSVTQLLGEVQVAIERITFSGIANKTPQASTEYVAVLDELLEGDISSDLLEFIHWLASKNAISMLSDKTGVMFMNHCTKYYREVPEVRFITAVAIPAHNRNNITERLRILYPSPARIIYEVSPSIVAGFVIKERSDQVDRSLRKCMQPLIRRALKNKSLSGAIHG